MRRAWILSSSYVQGVLALLLALAVATPSSAAGSTACEGYYSEKDLSCWVDALSTARYPGNGAHTKLIEHLEHSIKAISREIVVDSLEQTFTRWEKRDPSITDSDGNPVAELVWPLPDSGFTDTEGVTGRLHFAGDRRLRKLHFDAKAHRGKLVVVRIHLLPMELALFKQSESSVPSRKRFWPGRYRRPVSLEIQVPSLEAAREAKIGGLIVIPDVDERIAKNQYVPFFRRYQDVPAIFVDRKSGEKLIKMAKSAKSATLRHAGKLERCAKTRHLIAKLPATPAATGCKTFDQAIVIGTHTDGPNFFEDNGVLALWSLLKHYAEQDCRPRELQFVFASAHFSRDAGSMDDVLARRPELKEQTRAALVIEHLGAVAWQEDPTPGRPQSEPMILLTTRHDALLNQVAREELLGPAQHDADLRPIYEIKPKYFDYGEGQFLEEAGIPTIGFLTNPVYLLSEEDNHRQWFSAELFCKQLGNFRDLVDRMMKLEPR